MSQDFCVVLASTRKKSGPGKENQTNVAACFHAFQKVWVWLKPRKSTWGFYFVPAPSNTIHLTHEALNISRSENKGVNKFSIFLMFQHTLSKTPCWEKEQNTDYHWSKMYSYHFFLEGRVATQFVNQAVFYVPGIGVILRYT